MKTILSILTALALSIAVLAQAPDAFKYQAVIRDNSGNVIANKDVSLRIGILQNGVSGISVYSESFNHQTNEFGLVNLEIGKGTYLSGSFSSIDWSSGSYFMSIEIDVNGGADYTLMGTSQLLSVPYSLFSNSVNYFKVGFYNPADYVFLGFWAGLNTDLKSTSSGNTFIGNFSGQNNIDGSSNTYLGQASGDYNLHGSNNILIGRASGQNNMDNTNTMIGLGAGWTHETGTNNIFMGYEAGRGNKTGSLNVMIGDSAGRNMDGSGNVFIGYCAGINTNSSNKLIISNSSTNTPLIDGEFDNKTVTINDILNLTPRNSAPSNPLNGSIYVGTDNHIYCYLNGVWKQLDN
jgi:hypothetical protein